MNRLLPALALLMSLFISGLAAAEEEAPATAPLATEDGPLFTYVKQPDDSFKYHERRTGKIDENTTFSELIVTSQTWKGITWRHQMYVLRPEKVRDPSRALLLIAGGRWEDKYADLADEKEVSELPREAFLLAQVAKEIGCPVVVLKQVPFQPIFDGMVEDQAISYTFEKFLKTGDSTWPLLLPMVKSVVRAMDVTQEYCDKAWSFPVKKFTITGASKRGWTTWLTSAVDKRVDCLAPMVIDVLNMSAQMKLQVKSFGEYSAEINDYTERGIQKSMDSPRGRVLESIVDPFSYRGMLAKPKLILLGTNDRYWPLNAMNLYWPELQGEKHVLYVPNNGHGLNDFPRVLGSLIAIHRQAAGELKLPTLEWQHANGDKHLHIHLKSDQPPQRVDAWIASSETRDFRESKWTSQSMELVDGEYRFAQGVPTTGFVALFGEAVFDGQGSLPYFLSTNVELYPAAGSDK